MKVHVKDFDVDMELGNNGIVLQIWDNDDEYLGKLRIGKATVEWCKGQTRIGNGKKVKIKKLIDLLNKE